MDNIKNKLDQPFSFFAYWIVALLLLYSSFGYAPWRDKNTKYAFRFDAMGYYIYLPALLIYDDIAHFKFLDDIIPKYEIWGSAYKPEPIENGNVLNKYAVGQALFQLPWFLVAHFVAAPLGYPADGFSLPYLLCVSLGNILAALLALWYLRRILLLFFSDKSVACSLLLLLIATNYWCYVGYNSHMTHASLFALFVLLLWHTIRWHQQPNWCSSLFIGASVGFAVLLRPTDVVCVLIPLLWGIDRRGTNPSTALTPPTYQAWGSTFIAHYPKLIGAALLGACFIVPQLLYWKTATGSWVYYSYGDQYLEFGKAHIAQVLYSYKKGWLVYTPIMLFSLLGFIPLYRQYRPSFWAILVFFLVNFYLVASWSVWWYGGSFGQRALVQSYAFLMFPFTAFFAWALQSRLFIKLALLPFIGLFVWLNITQTFCDILESEGNTRTYFWQTFGATSVKLDDKKYLQIDEKLYSNVFDREILYQTHFAGDSLFAAAGMLTKNPMQADPPICNDNSNEPLCSPVLSIDSMHRHSPAITIPLPAEKQAGWLRISLNAGYTAKEWNFWHQHTLWVSFRQGSQEIKVAALRPGVIIENWKWTPISFDTQIPKDKNLTHLQIHFGDGSTPHALYLDDFIVERLYNIQ